MISEREKKGAERERERDVRKLQSVAFSMCPGQGTKPTKQACVLTRNRTCDLSVYEKTPQSTEPHQAGQ